MDHAEPSEATPQSEPKPDTDAITSLTPWGFPRLKTCPKCEYSLASLPDPPYRCPECGLEYDEFSCEWERQRWRGMRRSLGFVWSLLCVVGLYHVLSWLWWSNRSQPWRLSVFVIPLIPTILGGMVIFSRGRRFVAITPGGIHARAGRFRPIFLPWSSLITFDESGSGILAWAPALVYRRWKGQGEIKLRDVLPTPAATSQFAAAFLEGRDRYAGHGEGSEDDAKRATN